jgi:2,3-bisphosphoglycerate-dependent phosphoglycerate mutase
MARLYLIRHAQSANNEIWDGSDHMDGRSPDPELTTNGHRQAETLGKHLSHPHAEPRQHPFVPTKEVHFGLTHVYCSLMTRSILTAGYIADACDLALHALPDIFEKYGIYDIDDDGNLRGLPGPDRAYFEQRFPRLNLPEDFNDAGWWSRPAEDETMFVERMQRVVDEVRQRLTHSEENVAMVAHGDFIDQFVNQLMGVARHRHNYDNHWVANWTFHNTSISRVDFVNGSHNVVYMNRIDHLPNELVTW